MPPDGDTAVASTPASNPAPASPAEGSAADSGTPLDSFEGMGGDYSGDDVEPNLGEALASPGVQEAVSEADPPPAPAAQPAQTQTPPQPAVTAPPPSQQTTPPQPAPQPEATAQPTPQQPADGPEAFLSQVNANREALIDSMAKSPQFQLSEAEAAAFEEDPIGFLPRYTAKMFMTTYTAAVSKALEMVPHLVQRHLDATKANTSAEDTFYGAWKQIDRVKHADTVNRFALAYRQLNPQATQEQLIQDVGTMVVTRLGLGAAPANGAPPARTLQPPPFRPAGGAPRGQPAQVVEDIFSGLGQDFEED